MVLRLAATSRRLSDNPPRRIVDICVYHDAIVRADELREEILRQWKLPECTPDDLAVITAMSRPAELISADIAAKYFAAVAVPFGETGFIVVRSHDERYPVGHIFSDQLDPAAEAAE